MKRLLFSLLVLTISLSATTINVPADQTTIQAGIDAAVDGDTASFMYTYEFGSDLFFSEYIEGSGYNKALEIYNPTDAAIDLAGYTIGGTSNEATEWEYFYTFPDTTLTIDAMSTYVITDANADQELKDVADWIQPYPSPTAYNGNDARGLFKVVGLDTILIDALGDVNNATGADYAAAGMDDAMGEHTLVRKADLTMGNPDWLMSAGTDSASSEWVVFPQNTFCFLGTHPHSASVLFQVNMSYQIYLGNFSPEMDFVDVLVSQAGILTSGALRDLDGDQVYSGRIACELGPLDYKFRINGSQWTAESIEFRSHIVASYNDILPVVWYNAIEDENILIATEIMQNPSVVGDDIGEWIEIYNANAYPVLLLGYIIKDNGSDLHTITTDCVIYPNSYFVMGNNAEYSTNGGVTLDYQYSDLILGNANDEIVLVDSTGATIDSVAWDGGPNFPDPNGASMALLDIALDNSLGANWAESSTIFGAGDFGTPGLPNFLSNIVINPTELEFDTVFVNVSGELTLNISNDGNAPLLIDSIYTNTTLFDVSFTDSLIEQSAELMVAFSPAQYGEVADILYILSNDPDNGLVEIPMSGFGYYLSPDIELQSTSIDFGGVMDGLTTVEVFHIYNMGEGVLELDTIYCTEPFSIVQPNGTVAPGDSLSLAISFSPDDETTFAGELTIVAGNDPDEDTLAVNLSGIGTAQAPIMTVSENELYFGIVVPNETVSRQISIFNEGMLDLEIEELTITGSELFTTTFSDASVAPGESVAVEFQFLSNESVNQIEAFATIVAAGLESQIIDLRAGYFGPVWHVATTGSDESGDGSLNNAFASIEYGVSVAVNGDTILVAPGIYNIPDMYVDSHDTLVIASHILLNPIDANIIEQTILEGNLAIVGTNVQFSLIGLTSKLFHYGSGTTNLDLKFHNMRFIDENNYQYNLFFSIQSYGTNKVVLSNSFFDAEIRFINFQVEISNCVFDPNPLNLFNSVWTSGGSTSITSSSILGNINLLSPSTLTNIIVRDGFLEGDSSNIIASYSNIEGGWTGVSNINEDPQFCDSDSGDYHVAETSPCVGTGLDGSNMGAFGVGCGPSFDVPPAISTLPDTSLNEDGTLSFGIDYLQGFIEDPDTPTNGIELQVFGTDNLLTQLTPSILNISGSENWFGIDSILVVVSDTWSSDSTFWHFEVLPINDAPAEHSLTYPEDGSMISDPDSTELTFQWSEAIDIEGDAATYTLLFSTAEWDSSFDTNIENSIRLNIESFPRSEEITWRVWASDVSDSSQSAEEWTFTVHEVVGVDKWSLLPEEYALHQNYPNPFNPSTTIRYGLPEDSNVSLVIYDVRGQVILTLESDHQSAGWYDVVWNGHTTDGKTISTGIYFVRLVAGDYSQVVKMLYLK
jgi:hypothetical protein